MMFVLDSAEKTHGCLIVEIEHEDEIYPHFLCNMGRVGRTKPTKPNTRDMNKRTI